MSKKFLLGVGAQKAGTSWLWYYFTHYRKDYAIAEFKDRWIKEWQIWNPLTIPSEELFWDKCIEDAKQVLEDGDIERNSHLQRLLFLANPSNYFSYNASLYTPDKPLAGDWTPAHSGLSAETLQMIKDEFELYNVEVIPILIMREPASRLISMAKMHFDRTDRNPSKQEEIDLVKHLVRGDHDNVRCCYDKIWKNLNTVFGDKFFYSFYETIFQESEIRRLCETLEIEYVEPNYNYIVNKGRKYNKFSDDEVGLFKDYYQDQYQFAYDTFGKEFIDSIWNKEESNGPETINVRSK